eukprot:Seg1754.9 transcript_id=Seg1754.9/GoldUCD/mRNA.D3Y31 product="Cyclic nucleotide-binding domain-containing protein 2" protein_id=Seg1754.9/GoldUCD/D3Y31
MTMKIGKPGFSGRNMEVSFRPRARSQLITASYRSFSTRSVSLTRKSCQSCKAFKARHMSGILTTRIKKALRKPFEERVRSDLDAIWDFMEKTKAFVEYPRSFRKGFVKIMQYERHEDGDIVLNDGQFGCSHYFIISGTVVVEVSTKEEAGSAAHLSKPMIYEEMAGNVFGEDVTAGDPNKSAKVRCRGICDFLRIDNDDIEEVLKMSYKLETERRMKFLMSLDLFYKWDENDIKLLNASSRTVELPADSVILKDMRESHENVYFVMSGQVKVVRQIPVILERLPFGRDKMALAPVDHNDDIKSNIKIDRRYEKQKILHLVIQTLHEGQYFGVDEDIGKSSVISATKTELLTIPKSSLLLQQRGRLFEHMKTIAMMRYPNRAQTFQRYMIGLNWEKYKKGLVSEVTKKRSARLTACSRDVPRCLSTR